MCIRKRSMLIGVFIDIIKTKISRIRYEKLLLTSMTNIVCQGLHL